jgi:hypothetical protein
VADVSCCVGCHDPGFQFMLASILPSSDNLVWQPDVSGYRTVLPQGQADGPAAKSASWASIMAMSRRAAGDASYWAASTIAKDARCPDSSSSREHSRARRLPTSST